MTLTSRFELICTTPDQLLNLFGLDILSYPCIHPPRFRRHFQYGPVEFGILSRGRVLALEDVGEEGHGGVVDDSTVVQVHAG